MVAVLGGLGAALAWATATLCSSRSTRLVSPRSVLSWVMIVGCAITLPWAAVVGVPGGLDRTMCVWLTVSGAGNVVGLLLAYAALRIGKVGLIAPIVSTEGAIAAVIAVFAGEAIAAGAGAMLALIAVGVVLAGAARDQDAHEEAPRELRAIALAIAASAAFGAGLYATGRISDDLPLVWALLPARVIGVVAVAVPLVVTSRLRITRRALPLVVAGGVCEVAGFTSFALGARDAIAVSAVLASQFAAISAVAAFVLFGERLARIQVVGVVAIVVGVAILAALQAG